MMRLHAFRSLTIRRAGVFAALLTLAGTGIPVSASAAQEHLAVSMAATGTQATSRLAPHGRILHSTRAGSPGQVSGRLTAPAPLPVLELGPPLPLGGLPLGTHVTDQFIKYGILFGGQSPFITDDGSSPVNPTISGTPLFNGTITGTFVRPGTLERTTVDAFSLEVGYIDNPGSTKMTVYNAKHQQLGVLVANQVGFNQLYSTFPGAASFSVSSVANEPSGWEINTIRIKAPKDAYLALGDSFSSGEGTGPFPSEDYPQGKKCDRGPNAWPVLMADNQNRNPANPPLKITPTTLLACESATLKSMSVQIGELASYVKANGDPSLVTLTIGGNDLQFATLLIACYMGSTDTCLVNVKRLSLALNAVDDTGQSILANALANTYMKVKRAAGGAQMAVAGYPNLFPAKANSVSQAACPWLKGNNVGSLLTAIAALQGQISRAMDNGVTLANEILKRSAAKGAQYIPIVWAPIPATSGFLGHELCTTDPYFVPIPPDPEVAGKEFMNGNRNLGHPNVAGQHIIANQVAFTLGLATGGPNATTPVANMSVRAGPDQLGFPGGPLTDGTVSVPYVDYLISSGGTGADTWQITSGSLPPGLSLDPGFGTISGTPATAGTYTFTAQVTDSSRPHQTASAQVTIAISNPASLSVATMSLPDATAGQPYSADLTTSGGIPSVGWAVAAGALPAGLSLNAATGQVIGTPKRSAVGTATFTVQATDGVTPPQVATASESITVDPASAPLTVTTTSLPELAAGDDYVAQLTSTGGKAPIRWSVTSGSLPPGVSLDPATGVLSGTPTASGTFGFTAQVADHAGHTASAALSTIIDPAPALTIGTATLGNGVEGAYYTSTVQATGGTGSYQWSLSSGSLPAGLSLDPATGEITGTISGTGGSSFSVTVTDASGDTATQDYTIDSAVVPLRVFPTLPAGTVGAYYAANVSPSGGLAPYGGWNLVSGTLPAGLSFDPSSGAITGIPGQTGTFPLTVTVTDSATPAQQVNAPVTLTVAAAPALAVSSGRLVRGIAGAPYTTGIGYSGGQGPYAWAITAGRLPPGLTLDPGSGMITGTPTVAGTHHVTVQVTDSSVPTAQVASASLSIVIENPPALTIPATTLPLANTGSGYLDALQATGGAAPYTWSVTSGSLPAGLSLDPASGEISGTPTGTGTAQFTVQVTDSASATADLSTELTVAPGSPLRILTAALNTASQGSAYSQTLAADGGIAPYTWMITHGRLPAGLQLSPAGGIQGTPTRFGTFTFTFEATDASTPVPAIAKKTLTLTVEPAV